MPKKPKNSARRFRALQTLEPIFSKMPPLSHYPDRSKPFSNDNSEVLKWIQGQQKIANDMFQLMKRRGLIVFDDETGSWMGIDVSFRHIEESNTAVEHGSSNG